MHLWKSILVASAAIALSATAVLAGGGVPAGEALEGRATAAAKTGFTVPAEQADLTKVSAGRDAADNGRGEENSAGAGDANAVEVPENFGQTVSEFAQENASSEPGAVADFVQELLGNPGGGEGAGGAGGGAPEELPAAVPDDAGQPADAGRPEHAGRR